MENFEIKNLRENYEDEKEKKIEEAREDLDVTEDLIDFIGKKVYPEEIRSAVENIEEAYQKTISSIRNKDNLEILSRVRRSLHTRINYISPKSRDTREDEIKSIKLKLILEELDKWIEEIKENK
jgi:uncharacterized protein YeeX (DUF496 family)